MSCSTYQRSFNTVLLAIITSLMALDCLRQSLLLFLHEYTSFAAAAPYTHSQEHDDEEIMLTSIVIQSHDPKPISQQCPQPTPPQAPSTPKKRTPDEGDSDTDCGSELSDWENWGDEDIVEDDSCPAAIASADCRAVPVKTSFSLTVSDYLCPCGQCPQYFVIRDRVSKCCVPPPSREAVCRILQAFSTYNEAMGFQSNMIPKAQKCLLQCRGDVDAAFETFIGLVQAA
ncbi:Aste57867_8279 [Aphanomyces stellatus]|uniref:Aste57867_8279 protein n=1 Tax=Aphanomyces stellatus TaxID=120398 RepID=A0A485KJT9_9STRA|nr:hypothetical protein As57867_008248 [Aphanomyces stellatus]VFT85166.1 Aste57867_8279 [Aphanomyces stellatus]